MSCLVSAYCYLNNIVAVCQFICLFEIIKVDGPQNAFLNVYVSYFIDSIHFRRQLHIKPYRRIQRINYTLDEQSIGNKEHCFSIEKDGPNYFGPVYIRSQSITIMRYAYQRSSLNAEAVETGSLAPRKSFVLCTRLPE